MGARSEPLSIRQNHESATRPPPEASARRQTSQFAVLSNHLHLVLEPERDGPAKALQSLQISFARRVNQLLTRKGAVFEDRYHLHALKTPSEVRNTLAYVLTNEVRHKKLGPGARVQITPFTSAYASAHRDWKILFGSRTHPELTSWSEDHIEAWFEEILVREGWKRARPPSNP